MKSDKPKRKLNRSGGRPVAFKGEELINETTKERDSTRWFRLQVFIADIEDPVTQEVLEADVLYMCGIGHITCWEGERDQYWVEKLTRGDNGPENALRVVKALTKHEPPAPEPTDSPDVAKEKEELLVQYRELVEWIGEELKTDVRTEPNENPDDNPGNKAPMLST